MLVAARLDVGENPGFQRRDVMARVFRGPVCLPAQKRGARASTCSTSQRSGLATTRPRGQLGFPAGNCRGWRLLCGDPVLGRKCRSRQELFGVQLRRRLPSVPMKFSEPESSQQTTLFWHGSLFLCRLGPTGKADGC